MIAARVQREARQNTKDAEGKRDEAGKELELRPYAVAPDFETRRKKK